MAEDPGIASAKALLVSPLVASQLITEGYPPVLVSSKLRVTEAIV
jgi:hypothetical protein